MSVPDHPQTLDLLGVIEHQFGRSEVAIEHLRKAITRNGREPAFHHNLGNILRGQGRLTEALTCYERALVLAPDSVDKLYNIGNTCQDLGESERTVGYFERALRLRGNRVAQHLLRLTLLKGNAYDCLTAGIRLESL